MSVTGSGDDSRPAAFSRGDGRTGKDPPRKRDQDSRWPGDVAMWKRVADNPQSWEHIRTLGANESLGSKLGLLYARRIITEGQANAGRHFAELAGRYDRNHEVRRSVGSPAYSLGFGRDDEVVRNEHLGTIRDYERRVKRVDRKWRKTLEVIGTAIEVLEKVCIHDEYCPPGQVANLVAALAILAKRWGFDVPDHGRRIVTSHQPGAKLGHGPRDQKTKRHRSTKRRGKGGRSWASKKST
jgi:hypothetical protein